MSDPQGFVEVRLLQVPVRIWARAQEQGDALLREFALLAAEPAEGRGQHPLPGRLITLVDALTAQYGGMTGEQEALLWEAAGRGEWVLPDLAYRVPAEVGAAAGALGRLLDEADDYCRAGQHLLTLAADEDVVRFRWWFLDQFTGQTSGGAPVPWPDYRQP